MDNLPQNHSSEWKPSLEARKSHREWITGRVLTLLSHYWRDDDPVELTAAIGRDWADVLEGLPREYIQRAIIRFQQQSGSRKPTPGAIYAMTRELMPAPTAVVMVPIETAPYSALSVPVEERRRAAAAIMKEVGYRLTIFGDTSDETE